MREPRDLPPQAETVPAAFADLKAACDDFLDAYAVDNADRPSSRAACAYYALVVEEAARTARLMLKNRPLNPLD